MFPFPNFRKVTITRRDAKTGKLVEIPVDVEALVTSGDCSKDPRLEWGDLVEIPERDHKLGENWFGEPELGSALAACLARTVTITVRDQVRTNALKATSRPAAHSMEGKALGFVFTGFPFRLSSFVKNSGLLLTTSDQTHVRVRRTDPATGQKREWTFDLTRPEDPANDLWLRDGDEIEVPDK